MEFAAAVSVLKAPFADDFATGETSQGADRRAAERRPLERHLEEGTVALDEDVIASATLDVDVGVAIAIDRP